VQIFIANQDTVDLFATALDLNTAQHTQVLTDKRINQSDSVPVDVQEDGSGKCLLRIVTVDTTNPARTKTLDNESCAAGETISVDLFGV
jgi:hypothetical protein